MRKLHRLAFTLIELLVVITIIGILVAPLDTGHSATRETARRATCTNQIKQISLASRTYEEANNQLPYARKYDIWDTFCWSELILPNMGENAIYDGFAPYLLASGYGAGTPGANGPSGNDPGMYLSRNTPIPSYYCPSDINQPVGNQLTDPANNSYRGSYRGCVGSGDM